MPLMQFSNRVLKTDLARRRRERPCLLSAPQPHDPEANLHGNDPAAVLIFNCLFFLGT